MINYMECGAKGCGEDGANQRSFENWAGKK